MTQPALFTLSNRKHFVFVYFNVNLVTLLLCLKRFKVSSFHLTNTRGVRLVRETGRSGKHCLWIFKWFIPNKVYLLIPFPVKCEALWGIRVWPRVRCAGVMPVSSSSKELGLPPPSPKQSLAAEPGCRAAAVHQAGVLRLHILESFPNVSFCLHPLERKDCKQQLHCFITFDLTHQPRSLLLYELYKTRTLIFWLVSISPFCSTEPEVQCWSVVDH